MPLSLFNHSRFAHYRSTENTPGPFQHSFGGDVASFGMRFVNFDPPFHLIYRLDLSDPAIPVQLEGVDFLPLVYGFHYAAYNGEFIYRVLNNLEIEVLAPAEAEYNPDFPYPGHPPSFPLAPVALHQMPYDRTLAEDALSLQKVFGLEGLSAAELARAVKISLSNDPVPSERRRSHPDWTDEDAVRLCGRAPFMQGAPRKSCDNTHCTAEVAYHAAEMEFDLPPETAELLGKKTMKIGGYDVRVDTMRVIAMHQPNPDDELMWGDPFYQMIFEFCDCCHCIRVSNQCT